MQRIHNHLVLSQVRPEGLVVEIRQQVHPHTVQWTVNRQDRGLAPPFPIAPPQASQQCVVLAAHLQQWLRLPQIAALQLPIHGQVQNPQFRCLLLHRLVGSQRDHLQPVLAHNPIARLQRLGKVHAGIHKQHRQLVPRFRCHVADHRPGLLHRRQNGQPLAKDRHRPVQDLTRRTGLQAFIQPGQVGLFEGSHAETEISRRGTQIAAGSYHSPNLGETSVPASDGVRGLGLGVWGLGFGVWGSGLGVRGSLALRAGPLVDAFANG